MIRCYLHIMSGETKDGKILLLIDTRYAKLVQKTKSFWFIQEQLYNGRNIILRDFDGYDYKRMNLTLKNVVNNPDKNMGHAFVIALLLEIIDTTQL